MADSTEATHAPGNSPLFSRTRQAAASDAPPVVVVGLPRSGSSFLAQILSEVDDWYVFDDLYLYREAVGVGGGDGALKREQLEKLLFHLGWRLRSKLIRKKYRPPQMSEADVDRMNEALLETYANEGPTWNELLSEWMTRLARHHGKSRWGYKAPQDFMHLGMLDALFPGVRFIYLYRDPRDVMASFKNVNAADGRPGQYHPIAYALYWRRASETMQAAAESMPGRVLGVRFEELVADPQSALDDLASFLGSTPTGKLEVTPPNTSFADGKRVPVTPTEAWICERLAGDQLRARGYECGAGIVRLRDLPNLFAISLRFAAYQLRRTILNPAARTSIRSYLRNLRGGS